MSDPTTSNLNLLLMATGTASGQWGADLNSLVFQVLDSSFGSTASVPVSSSDVNLTITQRQNLAFTLTGTATTSLNIVLPLSPNSTTVAVGGQFIFDNQAVGNFPITVKTAASGSVGVVAPQGTRSLLYSDGTNVKYADDAQNQIQVYNGDPNGNVSGKAGSASTRADHVVDYSTNREFLCTTSGTASSAVWSVNLPFAFPFQGYVTASSDANNPILTADSIGAGTIYVTPYVGNNLFLYNGVSFVPVPFAQTPITLSGSGQSANGIYDVLGFLNGTSVVFGFSPSWSTVTPGSGARGTGGGTPQFTRIQGVPVNAVQQTVNNGSTTYTVAANRGTLVASVSIDSSSGQVTCHRSYGQSRKFGIWNFYNRVPIYLKAGDSTASWTYASSTIRPSNGNTANSAQVFTGLPEETFNVTRYQVTDGQGVTVPLAGVGWNATAAYSGAVGRGQLVAQSGGISFPAAYMAAPALGIQTVTALESDRDNAGNAIFYGTEASNLIMVAYRG